MKLFVDTSGWVAVHYAADAGHAQALAWWRDLPRQAAVLFTTDYVFDETVTMLWRKIGHAAAVEFGYTLLHSRVVRILEVTREVRERAWAYFKTHRDKGYSFTDCTSFVIMQDLGLARAFTLDRHFHQAGFEVLP